MISKVVCVGRNYAQHIEELGNEVPQNMVLFCKPSTAISDRLYFISSDTRFEGELCFSVKNNQLHQVGFGFDLTKANEQNYLKSKGLPWERAKAFDNSAILSEFVDFTRCEDLGFVLKQNGKIVQQANYALMIHKPLEILNEIQSFMHLNDGDVMMSGTPKGVGNYQKGDIFEVSLFEGEEILLQKCFEVY